MRQVLLLPGISPGRVKSSGVGHSTVLDSLNHLTDLSLNRGMVK